jgi:NTE family protein
MHGSHYLSVMRFIRVAGLLPALLLSAVLTAQQPVKNLVMEGGGIRGIAYIGTLQVLDSAGMLQQLERVGGTSAGAIQACLLAVGYTPAEILEALQSTSFKQFNDGSFLAIPGAVRLQKHMGWYKGEALTQWIAEKIAAKTGNPNISFQQLYDQRQSFGRVSLYITGTDLSWQRLRVFSHETYPNMRIADAVRISASIPFYFQPNWIDSAGRCFSTNDSLSTRSLVVDGGLLANYPLAIFDSSRYVAGDLPNHYQRNAATLGLQLEEPWIVDSPLVQSMRPYPIDNNNTYLKSIYKLLVDKPVKDLERTVLISNLSLNPRIRKLPQKQVDELLESGRQAARKFINERR